MPRTRWQGWRGIHKGPVVASSLVCYQVKSTWTARALFLAGQWWFFQGQGFPLILCEVFWNEWLFKSGTLDPGPAEKEAGVRAIAVKACKVSTLPDEGLQGSRPACGQGSFLPRCSLSWCHCLHRMAPRAFACLQPFTIPPGDRRIVLAGNLSSIASWNSTRKSERASWKAAHHLGSIPGICLALPDVCCAWEGPMSTVLLVPTSANNGSVSAGLLSVSELAYKVRVTQP